MTKTVILPHSTKLLFIFFCLCLLPISLNAQQKTNDDLDASASLEKYYEIDLKYFTNTVLINQFGEKMKFFEDLLKDNIVVINSFFSECQNSCSIVHNRMRQIQKHFGDRIGKDIIFISITVNPEVDRPEILNEYAKRFEAKLGWYFLSGNTENVELILKKLGKYVDNKEDHDSILLLGNMSTRLWKKTNGFVAENEIIEIVESVVNDKGKDND